MDEEALANLDDDLAEELAPLKDALERAVRRKNDAIIITEQFEDDAQHVAEEAIVAREMATKAAAKAAVLKDNLAKTVLRREQLEALVANLQRSIADRKGDDTSYSGVETESAEGDDASTMDPSAGSDNEDLESQLWENRQELEDIISMQTELIAEVQRQESASASAAETATASEETAAAAMQRAGGAVRDEMEASAVVKETQHALAHALQELRDLGPKEDSQSRRAEQLASELERALDLEPQALMPSSTTSPTDKRADIIETLRPPTGITAGAMTPKRKTEAEPKLASYDEWALEQTPQPIWKRDPKAVAIAASLALVALWVFSLTPWGAAAGQSLINLGHYLGQVQLMVQRVLNKIPIPETLKHEQGLLATIWLLLTSVVVVPAVCKIPGGSPVLGFLAGGALIGPHALGIVMDVEGVRHLAELGVVFLLFNIGLELSLDRLQTMQKFVFGLGGLQVVVTTVLIAATVSALSSVYGPGAIVLGGGLALSSTAVAMQVLADRAETGSRHGRAAFSVLLFQDLAVVVLLMLIPLLAPKEGAAVGFATISKALGLAGLKAVACIAAITVGGRVVVRPLYRRISALKNSDVFSATTLLMVLGTSVITQAAGLSLALGAFLAGLLLAETEYVKQVESDIAGYKGLLMGLFFMTVGMEISVGLFFSKMRIVLCAMTLLIVGKVAIMAGVGPGFGMSHVQSIRAGLLLASGGEFAFVAFGEAITHNILPAELVRILFLVVALSMALTPFLAEFGQRLSKTFDKGDMKALQPTESESGELQNHVIIAGFGRVGQIIAQLLSERLIPFVALDTDTARVQAGKAQDLPVYFGDAGSPGVLHSIGAHKASCAVITLDAPAANYRTVWALKKHFPKVKSYVRAHDVEQGLILERAGATAVVPETLEPSLQLAAAILSELKMPQQEVTSTIDVFRRNHLIELQQLTQSSHGSLGYGFTRDLDEGDDDDSETAALALVAEMEPGLAGT